MIDIFRIRLMISAFLIPRLTIVALKIFSHEKISTTYLDTKSSIISYFNLPLVTKIDDDKGGGSFSDENEEEN